LKPKANYWIFLFHATPPRSQRTDYQSQSASIVANFAALRGKCPVVCAKSLIFRLSAWLSVPFTDLTLNVKFVKVERLFKKAF
jgi:hypothetical protein